jgi:hypothetical protein
MSITPGNYTFLAGETITLNWPAGAITLGQRETSDGPIVALSMASSHDSPPAILLYLDPVSGQPMFQVRMGPGEYRTFPIDKILSALPRPYAGVPGRA